MKQQANKKGLESHTIRLEAGDLVGGSPPISQLLQHEPTMKAFNIMNFKVGSLGNHEFDQGMSEFHRLLSANSVHPQVKKYTKGFDYHYDGVDDDFDFLAANVVDHQSQKPIFPPYTIKNVGGVKVGFIGIVTTDAPEVILKKQIKDYEFKDEVKTANKYAKELKSRGVHAIAVVAHVPANQDGKKITGDSADIAQNTIDDVDIIFAGHNHVGVNGFANGKLIIEDRKYGEAYGDVRAELDPETNDFVKDPDHKKRIKVDAKVKPNTRDIDPDPEIQEVVDQTKKITDKVTNSAIGYATSDKLILDDHPHDGEAPLGNLITDAQRDMTGADFAFTNSGGIRLPLKPETNDQGEHVITWGAAYQVQPFGNMMGTYQMTGKQIKEALNQQWKDDTDFLQLSGLKYTYVDGKKASDCDQSYCVQDVYLPDGSKMDMDETYTVAMNEFLAAGGDGFTAFAKGKLKKEHEQDDTHMFIDYIKKLNKDGKKINPKKEDREKLVAPSEDKNKPEDDNHDTKNGIQDNRGNNHGGHDNDMKENGGKLPATASNMPLMGIIGVLMAVTGGVLVFIRKKLLNENDTW